MVRSAEIKVEIKVEFKWITSGGMFQCVTIESNCDKIPITIEQIAAKPKKKKRKIYAQNNIPEGKK